MNDLYRIIPEPQQPEELPGDARLEWVVPASPRRGNDPWCCVFECHKGAEFHIYGGSGHFEDDTQACEDHVGYLLTTPDWVEKDNTEWTVVVLKDTE